MLNRFKNLGGTLKSSQKQESLAEPTEITSPPLSLDEHNNTVFSVSFAPVRSSADGCITQSLFKIPSPDLQVSASRATLKWMSTTPSSRDASTLHSWACFRIFDPKFVWHLALAIAPMPRLSTRQNCSKEAGI